METQTHYEHLFEESGPRAEFGLGAGQTNRSSNDVEDERTSTSDPEQNTGHEETTQRNEEDPQTRQSGDGMASQRSTSNVEDQQDNQANPQAEMRTEDAATQAWKRRRSKRWNPRMVLKVRSLESARKEVKRQLEMAIVLSI